MPASWTWQLCDPAGSALVELTTATGRNLKFRRNTYGEAAFQLTHEDDAAHKLLDCLQTTGIPTLRCYRRGADDTVSVLRFRGYLATLSESASESSNLDVVFRGPFARLIGDGQDRGRFSASLDVFTAMDAGQIAKTLIDNANAAGFTGLATTGTIQATKTRDRLYQYANVGEAVIALAQVLDGFDWEEVYVDLGTTLAVFYVFASQGQDRPNARFEYGPDTLRNVREVTRVTEGPINYARVLGGDTLVGVKQDAGSVAKYGLQFIQRSMPDVQEQVTLDDKAQALLRPNPVRTIRFVPDLAISPLPWDDFWLGDTVHFFARRSALVENVAARVNGISVAIDNDGYETTEDFGDELEVLEVDPGAAAYEQAVRDALAATANTTSVDVEVVP